MNGQMDEVKNMNGNNNGVETPRKYRRGKESENSQNKEIREERGKKTKGKEEKKGTIQKRTAGTYYNQDQLSKQAVTKVCLLQETDKPQLTLRQTDFDPWTLTFFFSRYWTGQQRIEFNLTD